MNLATLPLAACAWIAGSLAWGALVAFAVSGPQARRREDWTSYWGAAVLVAVLPLLVAPLIAVAPLPVLAVQVDVALALNELTAPMQRQTPTISAQFGALAVFTVFLLGIACRTATFAVEAWRARSLVRRATMYAEVQGARVLVSDAFSAVFCVGGARPAIVLPRSVCDSLTQAQFNMVVAHEIAHIRRGDPLLYLVLGLADAVFWFNPFVHGLTARMRLAAEINCDTAAVHASASKRDYARTLVRAVEQESGQLSPAFGGRGVRIRLAHILSGAGGARGARVSAVLLVVASALCVAGTAVAASTGRMAVFGDPLLISALDQRVDALYGPARCAPDEPVPPPLF